MAKYGPNPNDFVCPTITYEEVYNIKQAFDLFDRDLGGAIDPKGTSHPMQNLSKLSTRLEFRPRHRQSTR